MRWNPVLLEIPVDPAAVAENLDGTMEQWRELGPARVMERLAEALVGYGPNLLSGLLTLLAGYVIVRSLLRLTKNILRKSGIDPALHYFISTLVRILLFTLLFITVLNVLGIPVTPLITALGALGLAISLSVQGSLSHVAGGITLLLNRPFAKGDLVEIGSTAGTVKQIRLFYTILGSADNKEIHLPNGDVAKAVVINYSAGENRRLDLSFPVPANCDLGLAKGLVRQAAEACPLVLAEPAPAVRISGQDFALVHIACLVWVKPADYAAATDTLIEQIRTAFVKEGVSPGK